MTVGCDIHMVLERRVGDHWLGVRTFDGFHTGDKDDWASPIATNRNYARFAALAGVRGDGPEARGLPADASELARLRFEEEGDHTPSWLPLAEAIPVFLATEWGGLLKGDFGDFIKEFPASFYFGVGSDEIKNHHLVFWFDS